MADRTLCGGGCRFTLGGSSAQTPAVPPAGVFLFGGFCQIAVFYAAAAGKVCRRRALFFGAVCGTLLQISNRYKSTFYDVEKENHHGLLVFPLK